MKPYETTCTYKCDEKFWPTDWLESTKVSFQYINRRILFDSLWWIQNLAESHKETKFDTFNRSKEQFFMAFLQLLEKHEGKFVAFVNDEMEIDDDEESLVLKIIQKHGNVSFYLDKVTLEENEIPIMSTKIAV